MAEWNFGPGFLMEIMHVNSICIIHHSLYRTITSLKPAQLFWFDKITTICAIQVYLKIFGSFSTFTCFLYLSNYTYMDYAPCWGIRPIPNVLSQPGIRISCRGYFVIAIILQSWRSIKWINGVAGIYLLNIFISL